MFARMHCLSHCILSLCCCLELCSLSPGSVFNAMLSVTWECPGSLFIVTCDLFEVVVMFIWPITLLRCLYLFRYVMYPPFTTIYRHHSPLRHYVFTYCHCSPIHHCVFTVTLHCSLFTTTPPCIYLLSLFTISPLCIYCHRSPLHHYVFAVAVHHFTTMYLLSPFTTSPLCVCYHCSPFHHYVFTVTVHHFTAVCRHHCICITFIVTHTIF